MAATTFRGVCVYENNNAPNNITDTFFDILITGYKLSFEFYNGGRPIKSMLWVTGPRTFLTWTSITFLYYIYLMTISWTVQCQTVVLLNK